MLKAREPSVSFRCKALTGLLTVSVFEQNDL